MKGNRQFYNFSKNIYGTVYKFTKTLSSKFFFKKISIPYPSREAPKTNLFLVYFRTFWILTIKTTQVLPWSSPPTSIKGFFGTCPVALHCFLIPHCEGNIKCETHRPGNQGQLVSILKIRSKIKLQRKKK